MDKPILDRLDAIEARLSRLERGLFHLVPIGPVGIQPDPPKRAIELGNELAAKVEEALRQQKEATAKGG